jgi:hypothetical protein
MRFILIGLMVILIGSGAGYWWWWKSTPQYSIEQVKEAVKSHDVQKFNKYVDVDTASSRMVDDFLTKPMRKTFAPGILGRFIVSGIVSMFRPQLEHGIKREILSYVESGSFKPSVQPDDSDEGSNSPGGINGVSLDAADSHLGFRAHAFKRIASTQMNGALAQVSLLFHNEKYDQDMSLDVVMRKMDGYWQVIELSNFPEFCGKLARLQGENMGAENSDNGAETQGSQKVTGI